MLITFFYRKPILFRVIGQMIKPKMRFNKFVPQSRPKYEDLDSWAAHPLLGNGPEKLMPVEENPNDLKSAAVFYIHPTGYFGKTWNATIDKGTAHFERTQGMLAGQASVFNSSCDIYAPLYRQATFFSFYDETGDGQEALAKAYKDVEKAFFHFLDFIGEKPFFIASHSQGSLHGQQLISKHIDGTNLSKRMIAAYLIGYPILKRDIKDLFKEIEICKSPEQVNCVIAWCTVNEMTNLEGESWTWDPNGWKRFKRDDFLFGTNPISWTMNSEWISTEQKNSVLNLDIWDQSIQGLTRHEPTGKPIKISLFDNANFDVRLNKKGLAEVKGDFLKRFNTVEFGLGNLHVVDYNLFWGSIRKNIKLRLKEYLKK